MAITVDWPNKIINVPKADTQLVQASPTEIRSLDIDSFRLTLKDLEDDEEGMVFVDTHRNVAPISVGGVDLARVVEIINGYTVTFEDGQYAVNLVGANSNIGDVVNVNQVSIRSANSAGLTYSKQAEDSAFLNGFVYLDVDNGLSGSVYPRGTISDPVNNLADAQLIINQRRLLKRIFLTGDLTIGASEDVTDYTFVGQSPKLSSLDVTTGAATNNLVVENLSITGDLNGNITARESTSFENITDFDGRMYLCGLAGTIDLGNGGLSEHEFIDCFSEVAGTGRPTLDCNDLTNMAVFFRRYSGGLLVTNFTDASNVATIDLSQGRLELDSTCTAGTIVVGGVGTLTDNSGPGCTVVADSLLDTLDTEVGLANNFAVSAAGL